MTNEADSPDRASDRPPFDRAAWLPRGTAAPPTPEPEYTRFERIVLAVFRPRVVFGGLAVLCTGAVAVACLQGPARPAAAPAPVRDPGWEATVTAGQAQVEARADADRQAAAQREAEAQAAAAVQAQARAEAADLLGAAGSMRSSGNLGIAWELGRQAAAKDPTLTEAQQFVAEVEAQQRAEEAAAVEALRARRAALDAYGDEIIVRVNAYRTAQADVNMWLDLVAQNPSLWKDAGSRQRFDDAMRRLDGAVDRLAGISPVPADAVAVQAQLRQAADEARAMTRDATRGRDASDVRLLESAKAHRDRTREALNRAADETDRLNAAVPKPPPPAPTRAPGGSAAPTPAPTAAPTGRVGTPVVASNWEYTVLETRRVKTIRSSTAKGEYVIVGVRLKNIGKQNFGIHSWDFKLSDASGVTYTAASVPGWDWHTDLGPMYDGEIGGDTDQMPPGVAEEHVIAFDVAPGSQGLKLQLVQARVDVPLT